MKRSPLYACIRHLLALIPFILILGATNTVSAQGALGGISPEMIRQQIRASGLTPSQIRSQLQAAGYPGNLLDSFLGNGPLTGVTATPQQVAAGLRLLSARAGTADQDTTALADTVPPPPPAEPEEEEETEEKKEEDEIFGLDVFRRATSQFEPILTGPVPAGYRLGPGDIMVLVLTGDVEMVHTLEVTREGFIVIPQVGQLFVNTLTLDQLRTMLRDRLGRVYSGIRGGANATTHFDITVANLRTQQVSVIGEVEQPGAYQISSLGTVLNALYLAGGPTERANFRRIEVRRRGELVETFDLYDYLLRGDNGSDITLEQGDVVFVPVHGTRATIKGEVIRPAIYELKPGETLADLVEAAGGFKPTAVLNRIAISRIVPPNQRRPDDPSRVVVDVPLLDDHKAAPFQIEPGDVVTVHALSEGRRAFVELRGNVFKPGTYGWTPDLTLSELIRRAGGFRAATYSGRAHIERLNPADSTRYFVDNVQLPESADEPFPNDVVLHDYDVVTIYGRHEFRAERQIAIAGMVNEPGIYTYREGMTLRDLILMARGLTDGAWLDSAEVARLPRDRSSGQLAIRIRVPLDSSYIFEGDTSGYRLLPGMPIPSRTAPEFELEPFDYVTILKQPEFELQKTVKLTGEVRFPGTYVLTHKDERISELLERAGGLLPTGYPPGASLHRVRYDAGPVDIDLVEVLKKPGSRSDLALMPGDSIHVPEYNPIVRVVGEVNSPVSVRYKPGAGLDYYISNAGGYTRDADKSRVSVRYANGSADVVSRNLLVFRSKPTPLPGSTVVVPELRPQDKTDWRLVLSSVAQVTGILGTLTAIVLTR